MPTGDVVKLYEIGLRGRPIRTIRPGDLAQPYARSLWQRIVGVAKAIVEVARDARELEIKTIGRGHYRRGGGW
jgi:hypothetical protein